MATGTAVCATCGALLDPGSATCARCGDRAAADGAPALPLLLAGSRPAPTAIRVLAVVLDVAVALVLGAPAVVGLLRGSLPGPAVAVSFVAALAYAVACVVGQTLTGRTPAKLVLGLRAVDVFSGLPLGLRRSPAERWTSGVVLDVRGARDPASTVDDGVWTRLAQVASAGFEPAPTATSAAPVHVAASVPSVQPVPSPSAPQATPAQVQPAAPAPRAPVDAPSAASPATPSAATPATPPATAPAPAPSERAAATAVFATPLAPHGSSGDGVPEATVMRPARANVPQVPAAAVLVLRLDDGQRFEVRGTALLGRNPQPRPGEEIGALIPVNDLARSVSKTHAQVRWDGRTCWVQDRGSTNGTSVADTEGRRPVTEAAEVAVGPGGSVRIGDRELVLELGGHA